MDGKIGIKIEKNEDAKEAFKKQVIDIEEEKKSDKEKELKTWFRNKPEEKKSNIMEQFKEEAKSKTPRNWRKIKLIAVHAVVVLILIASIAANAFLYKKYEEVESSSKGNGICLSQQEMRGEVDKLKEQVEKMSNITTQVEKIVASKSTNNDILKTAESGLTEKNTLAAGLTGLAGLSGASGSTTAKTENVSEIIKVAIYNGTPVEGLAKETELTLKEKMSNVNVVALANAKRTNYTKTIVTAINGKIQEAQKVAQALGGQYSTVPLNETKPDADVLVVVGK